MMTTARRVLLVALLFVAVPAMPASAGGGCHGPATEGTGVAVELGKACMSPTVLHVSPGATVTWTNHDPMLHNVYGSGWALGELAPGQSGASTFDSPGTYPYACTLHLGMTGAVVVDGATAPAPAPVAEPVAAVRPAGDADGGTGRVAGPLLIGLLALVALGGAFATGVRVASGGDGDVHVS
jgi:plastocyanin